MALMDADDTEFGHSISFPGISSSEYDIHCRDEIRAAYRIGAAAHVIERAILGENAFHQLAVASVHPAEIARLQLREGSYCGEAFGFGHGLLRNQRGRTAIAPDRLGGAQAGENAIAQ